MAPWLGDDLMVQISKKNMFGAHYLINLYICIYLYTECVYETYENSNAIKWKIQRKTFLLFHSLKYETIYMAVQGQWYIKLGKVANPWGKI